MPINATGVTLGAEATGTVSGAVRKAPSCSMLALAIRRDMASSTTFQASAALPDFLTTSSPLMRKVRRSSRSNTSQTQEIVVWPSATLAAR